ncbi:MULTISPECIES: aspartate carbamoyltransferase catalytic subunit [Jeotgalicoccus]|uniref:aspartate carbamoyltransferase catalytic subunit n=1 Tax=Jeotgalicoccus TaxID=227979 RepID=UPI000429C54E|nr:MULTISPECIES: aspartate carbamoyltransferase catalytic subunit [Jeotgalicoccus]QQD85777.1 aspartate carbamoyltransferase catalytic subunit [Jeotgalicoccus sp. ATCC 8456]
MKNLLSMEEVNVNEIEALITRALEIKYGKPVMKLNDKTVVNLFYENSTRTKVSFEMAEKNLNLTQLPFDIATSSVSKGESLYDTCKTLEAIGADALIIRHPDNKYYQELENINIPIINGGDGSGSHPTQSLLDMMTIYENLGRIAGLKIAIVGDIKHSRVAKSNAQALSKMGADVYFSGPEVLQEATLNVPYIDLDEAVKTCDVVMLLRVQHERHESFEEMDKSEYNRLYGMNEERLKEMKSHAIIMHPAPMNRGVEITDSLVECEKSVIFEQMSNGVFMRMSILERVLEGEESYVNATKARYALI